jgi:hypothetical protein
MVSGFHRQHIDFVPRSYEEEVWEKVVEPRSRSLRLVYFSLHLTWHVKVTFRGTLQSAQTSSFVAKPARRQHLMNLCLCIDFDLIKLLDDTVTELIIEYQDPPTNIPKWQMLHIKRRPDIETEYSPIIDAGILRTAAEAAWCFVALGVITRVLERCLIMSATTDARFEVTHDMYTLRKESGFLLDVYNSESMILDSCSMYTCISDMC